MAPVPLPGRPGTLTADEEEKLRRLWLSLMQLCGVTDDGTHPSEFTPPVQGSQKPNSSRDEKPKKKRLTLFNRKNSKNAASKSGPSSPSPLELDVKEDDPEDKDDKTKQFYEILAKTNPEILWDTMWAMVKHDHPDALALRFLRARKWDVNKALIMLIVTLNWRANELHVDDDLMLDGEAGALEDSNGDDPHARKVAQDFLAQLRQGKSFLHGLDKDGRPVCIIRVRLHRQGEQCDEALERFTVYLIETARMLVRPPIDTATIVFDLTGFSMANMDYAPVKFIVKCFEANYPESLGVVIIHKSPWLFQGIWKVIRSWLDPVVAAKINFTNNAKELENFISKERLIKELEGQEDWEYRYIEPSPTENELMKKDTATRDQLLAARKSLIEEFEELTLQWIKNAGVADADAAVKSRRDECSERLRENYWKLDPYIRARSLWDRLGIIRGANLDFYPKLEKPEGGTDGKLENSANKK